LRPQIFSKLNSEKAIQIPEGISILSRLKNYVALSKPRLASLVVFSAAMGFVIGTRGSFSFSQMLLLVIGGFLVTASSNAFNQIIERDTDKLMERTKDRPLPSHKMEVPEALVAATVMGAIGVSILWIYMNPLCGMLSAVSMLIYILVYTPAKRVTPFSVFIGAIPGAFPPLLGYVAATNQINLEGLLLYFIQFIWQFPHFWAIAWVLDDDYKRAGFRMLPSAGGRNHRSAFQTIAYTLCLIPLGFLPNFFQLAGVWTTAVIILCGIFFSLQSFKLYRNLDIKSARQLMFGSFFYLPVVQIALMLDAVLK
jgi:protoheme IX farnesyltransferase